MPYLAFIDAETRSPADLTRVGGYKYASHPETDVLIWGYAFDDGTPAVWSPRQYWGNTAESTPDLPKPAALLDHVNEGGYVVAWNAFFDRWIWNAVMVKKYGWPPLTRDQTLCAMAQAEASNLPGKLEKACETLGTQFKKDPAGTRLIQQLCMGTRDNWQGELFEVPGRMGHFRSYCASDITSMRAVFQGTRPLTVPEWEEYAASEAVNDRGVMIDAEFAFAAQNYAEAEFADINGQLSELCDDVKMTVTNHLRKAKWLHTELWPDEELQTVVERPEKEEGKPRYSADRSTREAVQEMLLQPEHADLFKPEHLNKITDFIELIEAGNSAAVRKFTAMVNQVTPDSRIRGQYAFNGAGQTGRFSSRGVQQHNMLRSPVEKYKPNRAIDAMEMILDGAEPEALVAEFKYPVSRLLARLIRPTYVAPPGKILVWADWDQIEARVLPWISKTPGGDSKLDLFRDGRDVYKYAAEPIFKKHVEDINDHERQVGKVAELALGFGGAVGAFTAMGRGYGVIVPEEQALEIVMAWRAQNSWCVNFWGELWEAAIAAHGNPGTWFSAGRVRYLFHPALMKGTLICELPDQRWLVYPQFKREYKEYTRKDLRTGKEISGEKWFTTFRKGFGSGSARVDLWHGMLAENITQGYAASYLRNAIVELQDYAVLHTHDEIVCEVTERHDRYMAVLMNEVMTDIPEHGEGLPLSVTVESGPFYTK